MKKLVTGAGGFIASLLTELLLEQENEVRALVHYNARNSSGNLQCVPSGCINGWEARLGDVTDPFMARELVEGCDWVLHLAALIGIPYSYHAYPSPHPI
jgi:nucleoside-diphosphate-sugar epimerase